MSALNGTVVFVLIVCSTMFASFADAKRVSGEFSGVSTSTQIDIDGDGETAGSNVSVGRGTFGVTHGWGVSELLAWDGTSFCSDTELKQFFATTAVVTRVESGDVFYTRFEDGSLCYNFIDGSFTFSGHDTVTGGTGIFAEATGRIGSKGKGRVLLRDAAGTAVMSSLSGNISGEINLRPR